MAIRFIPMRGIELFNKVFFNNEKYFRRIKPEPNFDLASCEGYEEFKKKLAESGTEPLDWSYSNLEGLNAPDLSFIKAKCYQTNFRKANLGCVNFSGADLRRTNLEDAIIQGGIFRNSQVHETNFSKADLRCSEFNDSKGIGTIFRGARLNCSAFTNARLKNADFTNHEDGTVTDLDGAYMGNAIFLYVRFNGAKLTNATLVGTKFENVDITNACLAGTTIGRNGGFRKCIGLNPETFKLRAYQ